MITALTITPFGYGTWPKVRVISPPHSNFCVASVPFRPVSSPQTPRQVRLGSGGQKGARGRGPPSAPFCWLLCGLLSWGERRPVKAGVRVGPATLPLSPSWSWGIGASAGWQQRLDQAGPPGVDAGSAAALSHRCGCRSCGVGAALSPGGGVRWSPAPLVLPDGLEAHTCSGCCSLAG